MHLLSSRTGQKLMQIINPN